MIGDILNIVLTSAENSFLQVGVFVGVVLLLFGYINYKKSGRFIKKIEESKKIQPILGALLGLTPGCGGAIFIMPLFVKGKVSYGTIIATLIATMGDSAFVIISTLPRQYIIVSVISFVAAVITGYIVDYYKVGEKLIKNIKTISEEEIKKINDESDHTVQNMSSNYIHLGHEEGDEIDIALHHKAKGHQKVDSIGYKITHGGFYAYWAFIFIGFILGVMLLFQIDVNNLGIKNLGKIIGITGTVVSVIMMVMSNKFLQDDTHEEEELKRMSLKETLIHNAQETAFVSTWVYVAYLIYEIAIFIIGSGNYASGELALTSIMISQGLVSVIIGALIGLIPGCGPQVIFVTLFTRGMVPFAALVSNAISQDGDALFPLLAIDKKSSLIATIITTVPALIIGVIVYFIEIKMGLF